jgi:protein phosphatase
MPAIASKPGRPAHAPTKFGTTASLTDVGRRMPQNEDALLVDPAHALCVIADGSGAIWPAATTLATFQDEAQHLSEYEARVAGDQDSSSRLAVGHFFEAVFNKAGLRVKEEMQRRGEGRATSAAVALTLMGPFAFVAHIGDARAYLLRDGQLQCLTTDHTLAMLQFKRGEIGPIEYAESPFRKTLTQAIGITPELRPDIAEIRVAPDDLFLLCSDGLHRMVDDRRICDILSGAGTLESKAQRLIAEANEAGGKDNITVALLPIESQVSASDLSAEAKRERLDVARTLGQCYLFQSISESERLLVAPYFEYQAFDGGDVVCREGAPGDSLFIVVSGKLRVTFQRAHLTDIGTGGWAGEISLARVGPRTATLTAKERTVLLVLTRPRFLEILRRRPEIGAQLAAPLLDFVGRRVVDLGNRIQRIAQVMSGQLGTSDD